MRPRNNTRDLILEISNELLQEQGLAALTFEAIAKRLGATKQAVIYWFPAKADLLRALVLPALAAETAAMIAAVRPARGARDAVARFVRAYVDYHVRDLRRFRLLYLAAQLNARTDLSDFKRTVVAEVPAITAPMYEALAAKLAADRRFPAALRPRRAAVAVHTAALGLVTLLGLTEIVDDPLLHRTDDLVETLVAMLAAGTNTGKERRLRAKKSAKPRAKAARPRRSPARRSQG